MLGAPPLALAGCALAILGIALIDSTASTLLNLPLGLQEIPPAPRLIARGTRAGSVAV